MAKFDVYRDADANTLLIDCQSDLFDDLSTRIVIPLLPYDMGTGASLHPRLNPIVELAGSRYVVTTQFMAAIHRNMLRDKVGTLTSDEYTISNAIDVLLGGV